MTPVHHTRCPSCPASTQHLLFHTGCMLGGHGSQPCLNPAPYSPPLDACRAGVDTSALLVKSGLTLLLVSRTNLEPALVFSLAQIASALVTLLAYAAFTGPEVLRSLRSMVSTPPCLVPEQLRPALCLSNSALPLYTKMGKGPVISFCYTWHVIFTCLCAFYCRTKEGRPVLSGAPRSVKCCGCRDCSRSSR